MEKKEKHGSWIYPTRFNFKYGFLTWHYDNYIDKVRFGKCSNSINIDNTELYFDIIIPTACFLEY